LLHCVSVSELWSNRSRLGHELGLALRQVRVLLLAEFRELESTSWCRQHEQSLAISGAGSRSSANVQDVRSLYRHKGGFAIFTSVFRSAVTSTGPAIDPGRVCVNPGSRG
jgi:hypothetical protein